MNRIDIFNSFETHPMHRKDFVQLSKNDLTSCFEFILKYDHLNKDDFALTLNRWMLDEPKPKRYSTMWGLLCCANSAFKE